jgi:hypothetical protein
MVKCFVYIIYIIYIFVGLKIETKIDVRCKCTKIRTIKIPPPIIQDADADAEHQRCTFC